MCASRLTGPRLQTAISVSLVLSVISARCRKRAYVLLRRTDVARALERDPRMPGSNSIESIFRQSCRAGTFLKS
jgi:hypothetical protein